jgi:hypothetical protein
LNLEDKKSNEKWKAFLHGRKTPLVIHADVDLRVGSIRATVTFRMMELKFIDNLYSTLHLFIGNPLNVDVSISEIDVGVFFKNSETRIATVKKDEGHSFDLPVRLIAFIFSSTWEFSSLF